MRGEVIGRRGFMKKAAAAAGGLLGVPHVIAPRAAAGEGRPAASERITMGFIGVGGMGTNNMRGFLGRDDVQVVAVCDVVEAIDEYGHWYKKGWQGPWFGRESAR
ncbi:MAG: twin-arginine translocation signal domain-containing protein, partial [Phycisphaerales bacterium]